MAVLSDLLFIFLWGWNSVRLSLQAWETNDVNNHNIFFLGGSLWFMILHVLHNAHKTHAERLSFLPRKLLLSLLGFCSCAYLFRRPEDVKGVLLLLKPLLASVGGSFSLAFAGQWMEGNLSVTHWHHFFHSHNKLESVSHMSLLVIDFRS